ncbi:MAG: OPT/YSL family transporter [Planctomycetaceae bacterium]|nr:OPT/YSL family transporter [Planctomycetaceae bacterium]
MSPKDAIPPEDEFEFAEPSAAAPLSAPMAYEDQARWWLANVYQGDQVPQFTPRAIISGMAIGGIMSISNLYVGLKTGWGLGVTITACIIAFAVFRAMEAIVPAYRRRPFSVLENLTMSSAASAAGYISSAGLVSSIPALYMATGRALTWWEMMLWLGAVAPLGVCMAIPLKRQLINIDQLPFPTGIATAETLRGIHAAGVEAMQKAKALLWTALAGFGVKLWASLGLIGVSLKERFALPQAWCERLDRWTLPDALPLWPGQQGLIDRLTLGFEGSTIMVAAGAIMGIRVGVSLLVGAVIYYGVLAPQLIERGVIPGDGYREIVKWILWPSTAMMVVSGLLAFAMRWRTIGRAFGELVAIFGGGDRHRDPLADVEAPASWFILGVLLSGSACVVLGMWRFQISWWMGIVAVALTFLLSIVAARATGETDITPISAMGKITQLAYGVIAPSNMTTNLMTASITAGAASHSADLLTDLKSGYLLGSNPRRQTLAQFFGVVAGILFCVPIYTIVVKTPTPAADGSQPAAAETNLGTAQLPAPSAKVWAAVAEVLNRGLDGLPPGAIWAMVIGGALGAALTLAEEFLPRPWVRWLPSATGLGIAGVVPASNSISMFLGALIAWLWTKWNAKSAEKYVISGSSGLIAGESLTGVAVILWLEGPHLWEALRAALW